MNVRKAKKAKKQAQARESKAKANVVVVETPSSAVSVKRNDPENVDNEADVDSGDDQLVIDTSRSRGKAPVKRKAEKKSAPPAVVTQPIPQVIYTGFLLVNAVNGVL